MLREHIIAGDEIGQEAQMLIRTGNLVPDEMVNRLVEERLTAADCGQGIILDGYPRTLNQAGVLLDMMREDRVRPAVVHLMVDYEVIVARLSGSRQCPLCKTLYSITTNPPKVAGICDLDGTALVTREDDRELVIRERLREYDLQTLPILDFFRQAGVPMIEVNAGDAAPGQIGLQICGELALSGLIPAGSPQNSGTGVKL
jgi:adenylate kinase